VEEGGWRVCAGMARSYKQGVAERSKLMRSPEVSLQARVINPSLTGLLIDEITRLEGAPPVARDKAAMLAGVASRLGPSAVVTLGLRTRALTGHPLTDVLAAAPDPVALMRRWRRLEGCFHSIHRTDLLDDGSSGDPGAAGPGGWMRLRHGVPDGPPAGWLDDLFVVGLLHNILLDYGAEGLEVWLGEAPRLLIDAAGVVADPAATRGDSGVWTWRWRGPGQGRAPGWLVPADVGEGSSGEAVGTSARVRILARGDLSRVWSLVDVGRRLGMSGRTLQRRLRAEGSTLSAELRAARLDAARRLLLESELDLTAVAFCCGFYDSAHFSRTFRRDAAVPPSAFRAAAR